jgi:Holliday junction DNA helicase RuvA subunit
MIAYLHGNVIYRDIEKSLIILETGGVGYEVYIPMPDFEKNYACGGNGAALSLFIYTYVREDRITLYGFGTTLQREIFSLLLAVKDVGPKLAVTVLSSIDAGNLVNILTTQDISALCSIKGIGQSKAERIIMELKNKILKKASVFNDIKAEGLHNPHTGNRQSDGANIMKYAEHPSSETAEETVKEASNKNAGSSAYIPKQPSDIIMESARALEVLGYSRNDSFNLASRVFGIVKSEGNTPADTEDLMRECLKHIASQKNI